MSTPNLSASERWILLHADLATGRIHSSERRRRELRDKGLVLPRNGMMVLSSRGWEVRAELARRHQPFLVGNVPWPKVEEITDLYLDGVEVSEIARRTGVTGYEVISVLQYRKVFVDSKTETRPTS